ncbi:LysR family transcriptional regulator [Ramlibacter alkalitolerans]|uniref:LysR family transcriptional regulator n=1 Tax=Ramlibacter alkalitolerans TaxID=2039631 RepID=A0ABS1JM95_9BURK|nr:LysR family transcriptional regulator [Ramlibacter alkalitolerans]MBL0425328.1 LysR family transcriptional regulator [Ramlibacter alkalitolerans]
MDKFRAMQTFVEIADAGSLTGAARTLGSSLPAVVRALAAYERELGVRLFHRTTRRISLTDEGRAHLERSRHLLAALQEAEAALSAGADHPTGRLHITAPVLFGQMYVAPLVTRFVRRHADLRCTLLLLDRVVNLLEEGQDLGIRIGRMEDSSLVAQQLGQVRRVVVATPALLRAQGTPQHPRDLQRMDCIRIIGHRAGWGDFQENGRVFQVPVNGSLEFNHVWPAVQACAEGAGFGMFFSYQVEPLLAQRKLRLVLGEFELPPRPISIVYPHARLLPARTRAFIAFAREELTRFRAPGA